VSILNLHGRVGHVFQGRFKAILVEKDAHLLALCRYIVRNPVTEGMVNEAADWSWSNYRSTAGLDAMPDFSSVHWVLEQFGGSQHRYQEYVDQTLNEDTPLLDAARSHVLGGDEFRAAVQKNINANSEVPRSEKNIACSSLKEIKSNASNRGEWMGTAYRQHGYSMREIADYAKVHYSLVSKVIKAWEEEC